MEYIVVFRNSHRDPHILLDSHDFKESFSSYESAKEYADQIVEQQGPRDPHYFDYQIYEESRG